MSEVTFEDEKQFKNLKAMAKYFFEKGTRSDQKLMDYLTAKYGENIAIEKFASASHSIDTYILKFKKERYLKTKEERDD